MAEKNVKFGVDLNVAKEDCVDAELGRLGIKPCATFGEKVGQLVAHYRKTTDAKKLAKCDCGGVFPDDFKACPYCGDTDDAEPVKKEAKPAPKAEKPATPTVPDKAAKTAATAAIVKAAAPVDEKLAGLTAKDLDKATQDVIRLKSNSAGAMWELGAKLREIHERQLWKLRTDDKGKPTYRSFESYCTAEVQMSGASCYALIKIAENFTADKVRLLGTSKLNLILKAPEEDRGDLEEQAKAGLTKSQLVRKVADLRAKKGAPKQKAAKVARGGAPPVGKGRKAEHITIISVLGNKTLQMYLKPEKKGEEQKPVDCPKAALEFLARAMPYAMDDLTNGVREVFALVADSKGRLQLRVKRQRLEE